MRIRIFLVHNLIQTVTAIAALLILFGVSNVRAQSVVQWRPSPNLPIVLVPRLPGETPEVAVQAYIEYVTTNASLAEMLPPEIRAKLVVGEARDFQRKSYADLFTGIMANTFSDIVGDERVIDNIHRLQRATAATMTGVALEIYLLAPVGAGRFPQAVREKYENKIATMLEFYVGLGGEDFTPYMYGETRDREGAVDYNPTIDAYEASQRKAIVVAGKAFRILTCRSFQSELALFGGYSLIQDLPSEGYGKKHRGPPEARVVMHNIQLDGNSATAGYLSAYIGSHGIRKDAAGRITFPFNSWHHEAVDFAKGTTHEPLVPDSPGRAVGFGPQRVLEMWEGPNFRAYQGHIELDIPGYGSEIGDMLMRGVIRDAFQWRRDYDAYCKVGFTAAKVLRAANGGRCEALFRP